MQYQRCYIDARCPVVNRSSFALETATEVPRATCRKRSRSTTKRLTNRPTGHHATTKELTTDSHFHSGVPFSPIPPGGPYAARPWSRPVLNPPVSASPRYSLHPRCRRRSAAGGRPIRDMIMRIPEFANSYSWAGGPPPCMKNGIRVTEGGSVGKPILPRKYRLRPPEA